MNKQDRFLVDYLAQADIQAPSPAHAEIQRVIIKRDSRTALFLHPDSSVTFPSFRLGTNPTLSTAVCIKEPVWEKCTGTIHFNIGVQVNGEAATPLWHHCLTPSTNQEDRNWIPVSLDLSGWSGQEIRLVFSTRAENSHAYAWAAWANPIISDERKAPAYQQRSDKYQHIILITADALSRRFLGCYGSEKVATPHIDALAGQSTLFEQACAQSTCTLGAYASMLSGKSPEEHGLTTEWGAFPPGSPSLPVWLNSQGYYTTLFASENELNRSPFGFQNLFNRCVNAISNPAQDGAITVRAFKRYWENRPDQPTFSWIQFFDTHPPSLPPKSLSKEYYPGNPEEKRFLPDMVRKVYGLESLVEMERLMPLMESGHPLPAQPRERFLAAARALQGKQENGPDLYEHLLHVPADARRDLTPNSFGYWLEQEVNQYLQTGKPSHDFLEWCRRIIQEMAFIQKSITSWLSGVTDFNYAIAQYEACTAYFDQHVGNIMAYLKETGSFDDALIILTSPHGELLKYDTVAFHHHLPHPYVFEIPLIVKTPGQTASQRIQGIAEHRDFFPSVLDFIGHNELLPSGISGRSWWPNLGNGTKVPRRFSKGYDINRILTSWYEPPLLYIKSHDHYQVSEKWHGNAAEDFLFSRTDDLEGMKPLDDPDRLAYFRSLATRDATPLT